MKSCEEIGRVMKEHRIALKNVGKIDPASIDDYVAAGGYEALRKALQIRPEKVIYEITQSGLRGRGERGFRPD